VVQFLCNLQRRFVCLPGISELTARAKRVPELRTQRPAQGFHAVARAELSEYVYRLPHALHCFVMPVGQEVASSQSAEYDGSGVARCVSQSRENRLKHSGCVVNVAALHELLATLAFDDVPRLQALFGGHSQRLQKSLCLCGSVEILSVGSQASQILPRPTSG